MTLGIMPLAAALRCRPSESVGPRRQPGRQIRRPALKFEGACPPGTSAGPESAATVAWHMATICLAKRWHGTGNLAELPSTITSASYGTAALVVRIQPARQPLSTTCATYDRDKRHKPSRIQMHRATHRATHRGSRRSGTPRRCRRPRRERPLRPLRARSVYAKCLLYERIRPSA